MVRDSERFGHTRLCEDLFERQELDTLRVLLDWGGNFGTEHEQVATTVHEQVVWAYGFKPADSGFFILYFLKNIFYRNIFSVSHFTVLYPYHPAGGRQGPTCK